MARAAVAYYSAPERCAEFINHWCDTFDPRNIHTDLPTHLPLILFERQDELVEFILGCMADDESGLIEKCRDFGATWVCCAISVWLWLFQPGAAVGWGSRKEEYVDRLGDPKSIFEKIRMIIDSLPTQFLPVGFKPAQHMTHMKIVNPANGSTITGEAGDNIGRGGRTSIYFKDESAHYVRPEKIEAALGDNTNCQIDISSVNGPGNVFHRRREAGRVWEPNGKTERGKTRILVLDWRDHPAKDQDWYDRRRQKAIDDGLLPEFEQEVNRNYTASRKGVIIPAEWVKASIDAHKKLGFTGTGMWASGLDVADETGMDTNAQAFRKGPILLGLDEWNGIDVGKTARRAIGACRERGEIEVQYDCIGVGAGIKAEVNRLEEVGDMAAGVTFVPWHAAATVLDPEGRVVPGDDRSPKNKDFYANLKAQGWWQLRQRFYRTWRAVNDSDFTWEEEDLISLDGELPLLRQLEKELSQPTHSQGAKLKMVVDKTPEGTRSPNLADAVVQVFWPVPAPTKFAWNVGGKEIEQ